MSSPPFLTLHQNNAPTLAGPFNNRSIYTPLDQLRRHPVGRLALGFARHDPSETLTLLLRVQGNENQFLTPPSLQERDLLCSPLITSEELVAALHHQFCTAHLASLRQDLSPFGQRLLDRLVQRAGYVWSSFTHPETIPLYESKGRLLYWYDGRHLKCMTIDSNAENNRYYHPLLPTFFSDFQHRVFGSNFPWASEEITLGCPTDERARRLNDTDLINTYALPLITHVPGLRQSYLRENIIEQGLCAKTREVSKTTRKIWMIPPPSKPTAPKAAKGDRAHLTLVHSSP